MSNINPLNTSAEVTDTYGRYLKSLVQPRQKELALAIGKAIDDSISSDGGVVKGPYLEATPPYVTGSTIRELVESGTLSNEFLKLGSNSFPLDRPVYKHQEEAIRKVSAGRNILVATGTGSGKTESFLIPILDYLLREREAGTLGPGVRALLLYPMNALANDQVKRIREILSTYPEVTFGRYTGETPETQDLATQAFVQMEGVQPTKNELISRKQMRETPPHILLTNYAMLEYLLLRPEDHEIFSSPEASTWKFIVADEAHTYDGAHGVEVALLLKKLRERVDPDGKITTIGTTATIGGTDSEKESFATNFFGNPYSISENNSGFRDLVEPQRLPIGEGSWDFENRLEWLTIDEEKDFLALANTVTTTSLTASELYRSNKTVCRIRRLLSDKPAAIKDVAQWAFGSEADESQQAVVQIIQLGQKIKDAFGLPAFQARFHLFAKATEGVFSCLSNTPHAYLARHAECPDCQKPSFELAGCKRCGSSYYAGFLVGSDSKQFFSPSGKNDNDRPGVYAYPIEYSTEGENEDEVNFDEQLVATDSEILPSNTLCGDCGLVAEAGLTGCVGCESDNLHNVRFTDKTTKCELCAGRGQGIIRRLESGNDAAAAVLVTSLYQDLPPAPLGKHAHLTGEGRKLMVFSDSRQQAAFFAPYLEDSYEKIIWRRVLLKAIRSAEATYPGIAIPLLDLKNFVSNEASASKVVDSNSEISAASQSLTRLYWEAMSTDLQTNLEGTGLITWKVKLPENQALYAPLLDSGFTIEHARAYISEILMSLRMGGIVENRPGVSLEDDLFKPRSGPLYIRLGEANALNKIYGWLPKSSSNSRLDFTKRVVAELDLQIEPEALLRGLWTLLTDKNGPFANILVGSTKGTQGVVFSLNPDALIIQTSASAGHVYTCALCRRMSANSVGNVCPRFRCKGKLERIDSDALAARNQNSHYATIYSSDELIGMIAKEHTAQLETAYAAKVQQEFIEGKVNVLSSSTTFELGVDVGELQAVLLRNMPPSVANYIQRAGRAGRRADSAALILTYAQRKPHDLSMYGDPVSMVAGKMRSPYVDLHNERILQRHIFSLFFSSFFKASGMHALPKAGEFMSKNGGAAGQLLDWVEQNSTQLKSRFESIVPEVLRAKSDSIWLKIRVEFSERFDKVRENFESEVNSYEQLITSLTQSVNGVPPKSFALGEASRLSKSLRTITEKDLIGFLSKNNLIPKYGFPVDTVPLVPRRGDSPLAEKIELDRDLAVAIFDYAPGAQVIAAGVLWESVGIVLPANTEKGFRKFRYASCKDCQEYQERIYTQGDSITRCQSCGSNSLRQGTYIVPEWGFHAKGGIKKPGDTIRRYAWNRSIHLKNQGEAVTISGSKTPPGVTAQLRSVAKLVVVNAGPANQGYALCEWCNDARPKIEKPKSTDHERPFDGKKCNGQFRQDVHLGHTFETDIVHISIDLTKLDVDARQVAPSVSFALLEGASEGLQISRDDIDVVQLPSTETEVRLALIDSVPAGAGFAKLIAENINLVFDAAWDRVSRCECGLESSCYQCLRSFKNQREHETLQRGLALNALKHTLMK